MGAGSSALIWYGLCTAFVAFVVIVSTGLILYGQRAEAKKRRARSQLPEAPAAAPAPASPPAGTRDEPGDPGA